MMMKLTGLKIQAQMKMLLPVFGVSLLTTLCWWIFGSIDAAWAQMIDRILVIAALFLSVLPLMGSVLLAWMDFYHSFFGNRAYLIRTLPLSRVQIYWSCLLSDIFCLAVCMAWMVLTMLWSAVLAAGWVEITQILNSTEGVIWLFAAAMFLQMLFIELCGFGGGLLGFRMTSSKLPWAIGTGILVYFACNLILGIPLITYMVQADLEGMVSMETIRRVVLLIFCMYMVINTVLTGLEVWVAKGRTDVE